jgi:DNA-binding transcriptional ArsR family regulator
VKDASKFFRVLADEARLKMLWFLFNHGKLCVCDIMAALVASTDARSDIAGDAAAVTTFQTAI